MNANIKIIVPYVTNVKNLDSLATLADGTIIKYAAGIQYETLRDAFEYTYPTKTLHPIGIGSSAYTTYGANSAIIIYIN